MTTMYVKRRPFRLILDDVCLLLRDLIDTTQHNCMIVVEWNYLKSFFCIKIALSYDSHMEMGVKKKTQQIENCKTNAIIY